MTKYVVLKVDRTDDPVFRVVGTQEANGPEQAVRRLLGENAVAGMYLTVPERNFRVVRHGVEQPPPKVTTEALTGDEVGTLIDSLIEMRQVEALIPAAPEPLGGEDS